MVQKYPPRGILEKRKGRVWYREKGGEGPLIQRREHATYSMHEVRVRLNCRIMPESQIFIFFHLGDPTLLKRGLGLQGGKGGAGKKGERLKTRI